MMTDLEIFKKLAELKKQDIAVCLVTIIETTGSTPREVGAKMIICVDGATYGSIGGGCGENQARSAALRSTLVTRQPDFYTLHGQEKRLQPSRDLVGHQLVMDVAVRHTVGETHHEPIERQVRNLFVRQKLPCDECLSGPGGSAY